MIIAAAGNVVVPAYLAIVAKGYVVERDGGGGLVARKDANTFVADDPIVLLGLITVCELRGENWPASDREIDAYLEQFG